jgi:glycosyltransferase involved in cell wall biosynthesis
MHVIDTLRIGGAEKLILTFAETLNGTNHRVTIVTFKPILDDQKKVAENLNISVFEFHASKIHNPRRFYNFLQFLRAEKPDIVHTHLSMGTILGVLGAAFCRIPAVTTIHNTAFNERPKSLRSRLETWVTNNLASGVIAVGRTVKECHRERLPRHSISVIPNAASEPVELGQEARVSLRRELVCSDGRLIFTAVGRLTEQKGFSYLLKAFAMVTARFPIAHLLIVGRGPLLDRLNSEASELGLSERVSFAGFRQDVSEILASSDVYVNSSLWEGMPIATLEAMSHGLPCVITRTGDADVLLEATPEYICTHSDPIELAEKMMTLLSEPGMRRDAGRAMFDTYMNEYHPSIWASRLLQYYKQKIIIDKTVS